MNTSPLLFVWLFSFLARSLCRSRLRFPNSGIVAAAGPPLYCLRCHLACTSCSSDGRGLRLSRVSDWPSEPALAQTGGQPVSGGDVSGRILRATLSLFPTLLTTPIQSRSMSFPHRSLLDSTRGRTTTLRTLSPPPFRKRTSFSVIRLQSCQPSSTARLGSIDRRTLVPFPAGFSPSPEPSSSTALTRKRASERWSCMQTGRARCSSLQPGKTGRDWWRPLASVRTNLDAPSVSEQMESANKVGLTARAESNQIQLDHLSFVPNSWSSAIPMGPL